MSYVWFYDLHSMAGRITLALHIHFALEVSISVIHLIMMINFVISFLSEHSCLID